MAVKEKGGSKVIREGGQTDELLTRDEPRAARQAAPRRSHRPSTHHPVLFDGVRVFQEPKARWSVVFGSVVPYASPNRAAPLPGPLISNNLPIFAVSSPEDITQRSRITSPTRRTPLTKRPQTQTCAWRLFNRHRGVRGEFEAPLKETGLHWSCL